MSSRRIERVSMELKRVLSRIILYDLQDPQVGFSAITKVETSGDLKSAKVFVSVLGNPSIQERTIDRLRHARGYIQHALGKQIELKYLPALSFYLDEATEEENESNKLVNGIIPPVGGI